MKDPDKVEAIAQALIEGGKDKLQVLSDFDNTLTKYHHQGQPCCSCHEVLEGSAMMPAEFRIKATDIKSIYSPIETDPNMNNEEKIPFMEEWYKKSHTLLTQYGVNRNDLPEIVYMGHAKLRDKAALMLEILHSCGIPVLIISAGVGDIMEEILRVNYVLLDNITLISNYMDFNEAGQLIGFKGDLIHPYNKDKISLKNSNYFDMMQERKNVILLGDSIGDIQMLAGMSNTNAVLKIGFLNTMIEARLPLFLDHFDIVVQDDQTMDVVNGLLQKILF